MFDIEKRTQEDPRVAKARTEFESAMAEVDRKALAFQGLGIEPVVSGWTGPMERGEIRMQGNSGVRYHEHGTFLEKDA